MPTPATVMQTYRSVIAHKTISFAKFLHRDPLGAMRRLRGYFRPPLFLFQMGKVGSSTHRNTLQTRYHVYHLHTLRDFRTKHEGALARRPRLANEVIDIITIAREPVGRKISTFFQNLVDSPYPFRFETRQQALDAGVDELLRRFHAWKNGIEEATGWYEMHFKPATGVDVYCHGFDREKGWSIIQEANWRILLLRFSDVRTNHIEALNHYLIGRFGPKSRIKALRPSNVSSVKWYAPMMKEFRERVVFSPEELDRAYNTQYMRHFHTKKEIAAMRLQWHTS